MLLHTQSHKHNTNHIFIHSTNTQTQGCCCTQNTSTDRTQWPTTSRQGSPHLKNHPPVCSLLLGVAASSLVHDYCCCVSVRHPVCCCTSVRHPVYCCTSVATDLHPSAKCHCPNLSFVASRPESDLYFAAAPRPESDLYFAAAPRPEFDLHFAAAPKPDLHFAAPRFDPNCILLFQDPKSTRFFDPIRTDPNIYRIRLGWVGSGWVLSYGCIRINISPTRTTRNPIGLTRTRPELDFAHPYSRQLLRRKEIPTRPMRARQVGQKISCIGNLTKNMSHLNGG